MNNINSLLILTQKCDLEDDNLSFFHGWIKEFAKYYDKVTVICLYKGKYELPKNVKVLSLGKEGGNCKIKYLYRFYKYIWQEKNNYDKVLIHMNQIYLVFGGVFWRMSGKRIALWFTHKSVNLTLRIAEKLAHIVFTASKESFRIKSDKVKVMGHGIDISKFDFGDKYQNEGDHFNIISIGRISVSKDLQTLIKAIEILSENKNIRKRINVKIIGGPIYEKEKLYFEELKREVNEKKLGDIVSFTGAVPGNKRYDYFRYADLMVHMSRTGSLDKVSLEAMASGTLVISCNDASREILKDFGEEFIYEIGDYKNLAKNIEKIMNLDNKVKRSISYKMKEIVSNKHEMKNLVKKIADKMNEK